MSTGSLAVWLTGALCATPAAIVGVSGVLARRRAKLITTTGRRAVGRILAAGCDGDGMSGSYWVRVEYDHDGEPVTARVAVGQRDQERYVVGRRVGLTFAPSRPEVVTLDQP